MGLKTRSSKATVKTTENEGDARAFVKAVADDTRRRDSLVVLKLLEEISGEPPRMWGESIVGFGRYHYRYASGREGDWMRIGLSPRKQALTVYCMAGFKELQPLLAQLGRVKHSVSCLYLPDLEKLDQETLRELLQRSWDRMEEIYPSSPST